MEGRVGLVLVLVLGGLGWCCVEGCWEEEKLALLQLKPFFYMQWDVLNYRLRYGLYNWVEEDNSVSDCCKRESVECDPTTGRVTALNLSISSDGEFGHFYFFEGEFDPWFLNVSLFLPFNDLKSLSLSERRIAGCLHNHEFDKVAEKLKKLEVLDLSLNYLNDSNILLSLLELSSLKSLNLSGNRLTGLPIHTDGLSTKLSSIDTLDLSHNNFDDTILSALSALPSLKHLDLSNNEIKGSSHINGIFLS
ncbi:Leucine-rich repeat, typical subtype [Corchorus olitorius]|uniref:Leucine-rich repeat, typical subtype n=1 Tax=Corchorus olitorius TaxID=93759 RepID=A0A1R3IE10_9ROSI|nr:Leucine-rich repeat, typical subtype [Corchorus olitorius]